MAVAGEPCAVIVLGGGSVLRLAPVGSGGGERDFDLALRVNLTGGLNVFEACRARANAGAGLPRVVFASSIAVFGGAAMPPIVGDYAKQTPPTTYGATTQTRELLVNDYTPQGFFAGPSAPHTPATLGPGNTTPA